ncbi:hypothetical protein BpHYR1_018082 [Brachionus plicatilis]|uniref:Uncharacterized protein n=1 Tax=Brachionus plicatilis TaxID=10195 RepID=A0A3M7T1L4_BRAPC|nr:hypothetical protein BpHYR1_018082 [Brachionus plicatilis]
MTMIFFFKGLKRILKGEATDGQERGEEQERKNTHKVNTYKGLNKHNKAKFFGQRKQRISQFFYTNKII